MLKKWLSIFLAPLLAFADSEVVPVTPSLEEVAPWFTGSLLASSATIVPLGHWNLEPYVSFSNLPARYDNDWNARKFKTLQVVEFEPFFWVGLTDWADLQLSPSWNWNYRDGPARWVLNDFVAKLDFQLYLDQLPSKSWLPSIKFGFQETFPTGKYDNLNPQKLFTDLGGTGAWISTFELAFGKIFHIHKQQWMQIRFNIDYGIPSAVHVKGINAYGGGIETDEIVRPGKISSFTLGCEYSLTHHWVLACDIMGLYQGKGRFSEEFGRKVHSNPAASSLRSSIQYSLAPAIEYNFSDSLGLIAGSWFTIAGKNSSKFSNAVIALNYYYQ